MSSMVLSVPMERKVFVDGEERDDVVSVWPNLKAVHVQTASGLVETVRGEVRIVDSLVPRELLKNYMRKVIDCEGMSFADHWSHTVDLSDADTAALVEIEAEICEEGRL